MKLTSLVQMLILGTLWGSSYLFIRVAVEGISPLMIVAIRLFLGAVLLFAVIWVGRLSLPRERNIWFHLLVMAIIGNVIPWTLISWAGQHIDSGLSSVLNSVTPLFTILFTVAAFHSERLTLPRLIGVLLGFAGVAILAGTDVTQIASTSVQAQAAVVFSSVCYGLAFAYARRFISGDPMVLAGCQILLAFLLVLPLAIAFGEPLNLDLNPARIAAILALGLLSSGLAYTLYYRLIRDVGATMASYTTYLIPIVGLFLGWLVLGETVGAQSILGVILILSGLAIATTFHRTHPPPEEATESATSTTVPERS